MRAQVVILGEDNTLLLARHERDSHSYWVLPGGAVERGESVEEAALREIEEETGLRVRLDRLLFVDGPRTTEAVNIKEHRHTFLASITSGSLQTPAGEIGNPGNGRLVEVRWMPFHDAEYDEATRDTLRLVGEALGQ